MDHCVNNGQCKHGQCLNSDSPDVDFICVCEPGWVGTNCEVCKYLTKIYWDASFQNIESNFL